MSREILFKAKRIDSGEWVEGSLVHYKAGKKHFIITDNDFQWGMYGSYSYDGDFTEIDETTICQYTGLTDKNGNKIWENDVVWVGVTDMAIVIFSEKYSGYILQPIGDFYFDSPMLVDNVDIIDNIIGNIFDNAELLEG